MSKAAAPTPHVPILLFMVILLVVIFAGLQLMSQPAEKLATTPSTVKLDPVFDFSNRTIQLDGQPLNFIEGSYNSTDPETGTHTATISYRTTNTDMTHAAAVITDSPGGSGTFTYLVGAMKNADGREVYSEPVPLGDRIQFESVTVSDDNIITVVYLDRAAGNPMSVTPTKKVTQMYAFQDDGNLIQDLN